MKKIAVSALHKGDAFTVGGHEYIVLDHHSGGVLALESDTLDCRAFGKDNDWRKSAIREYLNTDYLDELVKGEINPDADLLDLNIDLKATDGSRQYGFDACKVGLLTLEQYFKYNERIPLATEDWWLATPWGTPEGRSPNTYSSTYAWYIDTSGDGSNNTSGTSYGPRPALLFNPCLLVEVENDNAADALVIDETFKALAEKAAVEIVDAVIHAIAERFKGKNS